MTKKILTLFIVFLLALNPVCSEVVTSAKNIQAVETTESNKYPDYAKMYTGEDKHEKFNRKMFNLNSKLNKFIAKPVHILWSSLLPQCCINRIRDAYNNIDYPKRLASCIMQKDGEGVKRETARFLTNTTIGVGGLFDPADKIFKIKPTNENMEQALCKCKMNSGSYLVMPCLNSCTPRSLCGRILEAALDPSVYLASPITSIIKFGLMVNRTSYMQPLANMIETTFADPYDIHKKLYGIENYIRNSNYDRQELLTEEKQLVEEGHPELAEELIAELGEEEVNAEGNNNAAKENIKKGENIMTQKQFTGEASDLSDILPLATAIKPDIVISDYKTQTPVIDSMKTALFEDNTINKSIWNELSVWNRSFAKRIKTGSVSITEGREPYRYKYILQKDKTAPLMIFYPSIGEGAGNHHSLVFAKMFYDAGYSVVMQGSHFHWEFVKSMPEGFAPGIPSADAEYIRQVSAKILENLKEQYGYEPKKKVIVGTSFGAVGSLFVAEKESKDNTLSVNRYIAISPPIELKYALLQLDKNGEEFDKESAEVKDKTALTAAKILQIYGLKDEKNFHTDTLPFTDEEAKLITTFIMRQKLSDIIFTIEHNEKNKAGIYKMINNMSFQDYAEKYLGLLPNDECLYASLYALSEYLTNNDNYHIYESIDDYLLNENQISRLKNITEEKLTCINCGSHLGFLYKKEFIEEFKKFVFKS